MVILADEDTDSAAEMTCYLSQLESGRAGVWIRSLWLKRSPRVSPLYFRNPRCPGERPEHVNLMASGTAFVSILGIQRWVAMLGGCAVYGSARL